MPYYTHQLTPAYYDTLIQWELIEEIMILFEDHEHPEGYQTLFHTLDCVVLETVLHHLPNHHHDEFLLLCTHQHHEPNVLSWLEERSEGISDHIRDCLYQTKQELKLHLAADMAENQA